MPIKGQIQYGLLIKHKNIHKKYYVDGLNRPMLPLISLYDHDYPKNAHMT